MQEYDDPTTAAGRYTSPWEEDGWMTSETGLTTDLIVQNIHFYSYEIDLINCQETFICNLFEIL